MALTSVSSGNVIHASDIDQFINFLTGVMTDQSLLMVVLEQIKARGAAPGALTAALAAGGSIDIGAHDYAVTFVGVGGGETLAGTHTTLTTTTGNQTANLSAIPTGPTGTSSRKIYRSKVGTTSPLFLLHTIADNTTTTYTDSVADSSLPATTSPAHPNFGGATQWQDSTGAVKAQVYSDGAVSFDASNFWSDGAGNVTAVSLTATGNINSNGDHVPYLVPNGTTAGRQIFLGTATPTGANEGDIWIKA